MKRILSQPVRAYVYRVLTAAAPILAFHGIAADQALTLYLALGGTILGVGLAAVNTPTTPDVEG